MQHVRRLIAVMLLCPFALAAQETHPAGHAHDKAPALGTIVFPNSGNAAAQPHFLKAVALLHSFEYEQAADAFKAAQKADPAFALPYWGEAFSYSHVLWRYENLPESRAALQRLAPTADARVAKANTPQEKSFGAAIEAFFADGPLPQRAERYANAMRAHAAAFPDDPEAAAFASHAIMQAGYSRSGPARDSLFREAIRLAQKVVTANPNHPGGTHYLIHLYDSPGMAQDGLAFARAYDKIAPDAEHALHMPSHIYLQLGMWDDVSRSNERAWAASRRDAAATGPGNADWHAFAWLHYAYLQQGRFRDAAALIDSARTLLAGASGPYIDARFALTRMQFQQAAETWRWGTQLTPPPDGGGSSDRERGFREQARFWMTVAAAHRLDTTALARLSPPYLATADSVLAGKGGSMTPMRATNAMLVRALVAEVKRSPDIDQAWRDAVDAESRLQAFVGPPERVFAAEGRMMSLLRQAPQMRERRAEFNEKILDAMPALEHVLKLCPERSRTLRMLAMATEFLGQTAEYDRYMARLAVNYRQADVEQKRQIPGLR